jgi:acetyl esterase/lipase
MKTLRHVLAVLSLSATLCAAEENGGQVFGDPAPAAKPSPPKQPAHGPGGSDYQHRAIRETEHGEGGRQFWIIEPAQPSPKQAPLVIFIHGWSAMAPDTYRGWINHLAKRGNIVVYPRYQERLFTPAAEYFPNVVASVHAAIEVLKQAGHVAPDLSRVALVGHSVGGVQMVNYAVAARDEGLPIAKAVMSVEPGQGAERGIKLVPMRDPATFPAETKLLVVIGDSDGMVGSECARTIWRGTKHVTDRAFITVQSDSHGSPPLNANHLAPISWNRAATDALDWLGYWRTFDALMDAAFSGKPLAVESSMGAWSDGVPVTPMKVER